MYIYISEIDRLLAKLDIEFSDKTCARMTEEEKYHRIFSLRDSDNKC